jgi:proton-dependent oligopeptide transporter, POT family
MNSRSQPKGVVAMYMVQLLSCVGYASVTFMLVLYCTNALGLTDSASFSVNAAYVALLYAAHVTGGLIAERYIGYQRAIIWGLILCAIGNLLLMWQTTTMLYIAASVFIVGTGLNVPAGFVLLGRLYKADDARREKGFTIIYMGMNMGMFFACGAAGPIAKALGFPVLYAIGCGFTILTLAYYYFIQKHFLQDRLNFSRARVSSGALLCFISIPITALLLQYSGYCNAALLALGVLCVIALIYLACKQETVKAKNKLLAFLCLTMIATVFWALYNLGPSALTIFTERNVDRTVLGYTIPAGSFNALNPLFIVLIGPFMGGIWLWLRRFGWHVTLAEKFAGGVIIMGLGYLVLIWGIDCQAKSGLIAVSWIVLSYLLQTLAELMIGPVGFAMVGQLVPDKMEGFMMGIWELSSGIAGAISGYLANMTSTPGKALTPLQSNPTYAHAFAYFAYGSIIIGILMIAFVPVISRMTQERPHKTKRFWFKKLKTA